MNRTKKHKIIVFLTSIILTTSTVFAQDTDGDGIFDDGDNSGIVGDYLCTSVVQVNCDDNCLVDANPSQTDSDADGKGDICDSCPYDAKNDVDQDGLCACHSYWCNNSCTGGNKLNCDDNCPYIYNQEQEDCNNDGIGDVCDSGDIGDTNCPQIPCCSPGDFSCDTNDYSDCIGTMNFNTAENPALLKFYSNYDLFSYNSKVTRAIIGIHGISRKWLSAFESIFKPARDEEDLFIRNTLIISPYFMNDDDCYVCDPNAEGCSDAETCDEGGAGKPGVCVYNSELCTPRVVWDGGEWKHGEHSTAPSDSTVSSFAAI